jgi:hypothetical protein
MNIKEAYLLLNDIVYEIYYTEHNTHIEIVDIKSDISIKEYHHEMIYNTRFHIITKNDKNIYSVNSNVPKYSLKKYFAIHIDMRNGKYLYNSVGESDYVLNIINIFERRSKLKVILNEL